MKNKAKPVMGKPISEIKWPKPAPPITARFEFVDTKRTFKWRFVLLRAGKVVCRSHFSKHYEGITTVKFEGKDYGVVTQYFEGALRVETVFEIKYIDTVIKKLHRDPDPFPKAREARV